MDDQLRSQREALSLVRFFIDQGLKPDEFIERISTTESIPELVRGMALQFAENYREPSKGEPPERE